MFFVIFTDLRCRVSVKKRRGRARKSGLCLPREGKEGLARRLTVAHVVMIDHVRWAGLIAGGKRNPQS